MPRYLSLHTLACLTRQGAEQLAARLESAPGLGVRRVLVNMTEGRMLVEYEATERDVVAGWFEREKFHHDWLLRVELEAKEGKLVPAD
jgi:hypothetical protein